MNRLGIAIGALIVFGLVAYNIQLMYFNATYLHDVHVLKQDIRKQQVLKQNLERQLRLVKQEPYIEMKARTILGLVKRGEIAYQIIRTD